jgi:uncharacterized protein
MSSSQTPPGSNASSQSGPATGAGTASGNDPSMEDILASIRRILSEDEAPATGTQSLAPASPPSRKDADDGVLLLDPAMMVPEMSSPAGAPMTEPTSQVTLFPPEPKSAELVAPEAAAAAASSVGSLVRTLAAERGTHIYSGGPTLEEIVRDELRPLLKLWLDENLPPLVERLVRAEIERVVGRAVP